MPGEQICSAPRVLSGNQVDFPQNPQSPQGDVFEVPDRSGHDEQRAGHDRAAGIVPLADRERLEARPLPLCAFVVLFLVLGRVI